MCATAWGEGVDCSGSGASAAGYRCERGGEVADGLTSSVHGFFDNSFQSSMSWHEVIELELREILEMTWYRYAQSWTRTELALNPKISSTLRVISQSRLRRCLGFKFLKDYKLTYCDRVSYSESCVNKIPICVSQNLDFRNSFAALCRSMPTSKRVFIMVSSLIYRRYKHERCRFNNGTLECLIKFLRSVALWKVCRGT